MPRRPRNAGAPSGKLEGIEQILQAKGLNVIEAMAALAIDPKTPAGTRSKMLELLADRLVPKQKAVDSEIKDEVARFVILGSEEDESSAAWEARNSHWREWYKNRVIEVVAGPGEKVPEGVVPS